MRFWSRAFRFVLLVSVLLNLGDAPYLDEIFAEESQHQQQSVQVSINGGGGGGGEPSSPQAPDPSNYACCGYQLLLHLHAMVAEAVTLPVVNATKDLLPQEFLFVGSAPLDRIDRPPCSNFLVV